MQNLILGSNVRIKASAEVHLPHVVPENIGSDFYPVGGGPVTVPVFITKLM
jgi:hypothetical protein